MDSAEEKGYKEEKGRQQARAEYEQPEARPVKQGEKIQADTIEYVEEPQSEPELMETYHEPTRQERIIGGIKQSTSKIIGFVREQQAKTKAKLAAQNQQPQQTRRVVRTATPMQPQRPFYETQNNMGSPIFGNSFGGSQSNAMARMGGGISPLAQMGLNMKFGNRPARPAKAKRPAKARRQKVPKPHLSVIQQMALEGMNRGSMFGSGKKNRWY